jgi:hypothetical protein
MFNAHILKHDVLQQYFQKLVKCYYIFIFSDTLLQTLCFPGNLSFIPTIRCDYLHVSMVAFYGTKQQM